MQLFGNSREYASDIINIVVGYLNIQNYIPYLQYILPDLIFLLTGLKYGRTSLAMSVVEKKKKKKKKTLQNNALMVTQIFQIHVQVSLKVVIMKRNSFTWSHFSLQLSNLVRRA